MNKKLIWSVIAILIILGIIVNYQRSNKVVSSQTYKIGVILPLTGEVSVTGEKLLQGVQLAQKELDPKKFVFIIEDDHSKITDSVTAAKKLLEVDKVDVLVGLYIPESVIAVAPLAKEKGVTIFSGTYCSDAFKDLDNVFCGYPSALSQLKTVIPEIKSNNIKTVALVNSNEDFGINSRDGMLSLASEGGYSVVLNELVPFKSRDLKTQADKVIASKADAIFMASNNPSQAFTLMKLLSERNYKGMRVTFIDIDKKALKDFGSSVEGTYAPGIAPNRFSEDFTKKYTVAYNKAPEDYVVALGYDITRVVAGIMSQTGFDAKNFVSDAVKYNYVNPAIKDFHYKEDHSINFALELWQAKEGDYVAVPSK